MEASPGATTKKRSTAGKSRTVPTKAGLHQDAFDHSLQANILSIVSSGKIILVNAAACKLLGYSKPELLAKPWPAIFDINESGFKKMLKQRRAEGRSQALVTGIKKNGGMFSCSVTTAVFTSGDGIKKAITSIADMDQPVLEQKKIDTIKEKIVTDNIILARSKQKQIDIRKERTVADNIALVESKQKLIDTGKEKIVADNIVLAQEKSDARLQENIEWIRYIAETSYDVMWDWNIATGQIYVGDSIKEVFGYKVRNNHVHFTEFCNCLVAGRRDGFERKLLKTIDSGSKNWNDSYLIKRYDGSVASVVSRANIIRDGEGKAIQLIGAIKDVTRLKQLEMKLAKQLIIHEEDSEKFLLATKISFDVIWDWNILTDEVFIGEGFEELFGYGIKNNKGIIADWFTHIHPDDKEGVEKRLQAALASPATYWEHGYRFTRADGSIAKVFNRGSILRQEDGKAYRMIGAMQDISDQNILEEKLEQEIKLKQKQIAEATEDAKNTERSDIGKELHDNINQLLGASKMYLDMAKKGDANSGMYLSRCSEYTLSAIEEIRKLTKGLITDIIRNLGLCEAIDNIARDTMEVNPVKISCMLDSFAEHSVSHKFKLNIFRIVQEQLNNILKHAKASLVVISLSQDKKSVILCISDNGVGFDTSKKQEGIGLTNIKNRATSFNGTAEFVSKSAEGCVLTVLFPLTDPLHNKD